MSSFNRVILLGNVTREPQLKYLPSQTAVVEAGLAVNRKYTAGDGEKREEVTFIDFACFGKGAEVIQKYVSKGDPLLIEGRLKYDTWEDKQGGGKRSKISVVVENFQLMGGKRSDEQPERSGQGAPSRPRRPAAEDPFANQPASVAATEEDIPFAPNKY